ncbi:M50 family metallopeptidase [Hydrocarboniphaga sp.]|uniref:M50 family metallopeptidase n=1 Tax=Hydrocarboniphaga sp. TaxID=2033016 RepID=UPI003D0E595C
MKPRPRARKPHHKTSPLQALLAATALTLALYLIPHAQLLAWPLILISTVVHELGHGLSALLLGGRFVALYVWPDASGRALYIADFGRIGHALVAAGGLLGPSLLASALFAAGRHPQSARRALGIAAVVLLAVELIWVRNVFGAIFIGLLIVMLGLLARRASPLAAQIGVVFLAVQLALSVFSRSDYLFMRSAVTAAGVGPSDTGQIAAALYLPYWFWGGLIAMASLMLLWHGLRTFAAALKR